MANRRETSKPISTRPAEEAIQAVSAALKTGKSALAKPAKPATLPRFPDVSKPPGQPTGPRAGALSPSIDPPPVRMPDRAASVSGGSAGELSPVPSEKASPKASPTNAAVPSTPSAPQAGSIVPDVVKAIGTPAAAAAAAPHRLDIAVGLTAGHVTPELPKQALTQRDSLAMAGATTKSEASNAGSSPSVGPLVAPSRPDLVATGTNASTPGQGSVTPASRPASSAPASVGATLGVGRATMPGAASPARSFSSPTVAVPNSFSTGLRNLSGASQASVGVGRASPDLGGGGQSPADHGFGSSSSSSSSESGGQVDMSKTNELLQHLLDAARSQRDASMPIGGSPAYSGR